jgi:predicted lipoprotein
MLLRAILIGLLSTVLAACGGDDAGTNGSPDAGDGNGDGQGQARREVLAHLGDSVILPTYRQFEEAAASLEEATGAYAGSLSTEDRDAAREAWRSATEVWQRAELMQVGPAGVMPSESGMTGVLGGEGIRDRIYSWPLVNPCRIDQVTVDQGYEGPESLAGELVNVRGLDAMEYLLFKGDTENSCPPNLPINAEGKWSDLGTEGVKDRRAQYAHNAAQLVHQAAEELVSAWAAEEGNFLAELSSAGDGSNTYDTAQEGLNQVSNAMFYVEKETKEKKLGVPSGVNPDCSESTCPAKLESQFARRSKQHVVQNLRGFQMLLLGGMPEDNGPGFDDLLMDMGAGELSTNMADATSSAIDSVQGIEGTLAETLESDRSRVVSAHGAVKDITDLLKSQFLGVLDLQPPPVAEGDND